MVRRKKFFTPPAPVRQASPCAIILFALGHGRAMRLAEHEIKKKKTAVGIGFRVREGIEKPSPCPALGNVQTEPSPVTSHRRPLAGYFCQIRGMHPIAPVGSARSQTPRLPSLPLSIGRRMYSSLSVMREGTHNMKPGTEPGCAASHRSWALGSPHRRAPISTANWARMTSPNAMQISV